MELHDLYDSKFNKLDKTIKRRIEFRKIKYKTFRYNNISI